MPPSPESITCRGGHVDKWMKHRQQWAPTCMKDTDRVWEKDRRSNMPVGKVMFCVTYKQSACLTQKLSLKSPNSLWQPCTYFILSFLPVYLLATALVEELLKLPVVRTAGASWSSWESWSSCSQSCAKGYRTRRRTCAGPEGKSAPVACRGSPVEYQDCNVQACPGEWRSMCLHDWWHLHLLSVNAYSVSFTSI